MKYKYNNQWVDLSIKALDSMEIGCIIQFMGNTIPTGWLECDGSSISQSDYPDLYALIGGTLPNFKGRVLVGQDTSDSDFDTLGETGGSKDLQQHNHETLWQAGNGAGTGTGSYAGMPAVFGSYAIPGMTEWASKSTGTGNSGNLQPYAVVKHIIKALNTTPTMASIVNGYSTSTQDGYSCDYINDCNTYSTSEVDTGKVWIDGKKIYRKVITTTTGSSINSWKSLGPTNINTLISYSGEIIAASSEILLLPYSTDTRHIWFRTTYGSIQEAHNDSYLNSKDISIVFEYTKTS